MWTLWDFLQMIGVGFGACILSVPVYKWRLKRQAEREMANLLRRER